MLDIESVHLAMLDDLIEQITASAGGDDERMRGMRKVIAHDYASVNLQIVWEFPTVHAPRSAQGLL
jgi:hypothetical protein